MLREGYRGACSPSASNCSDQSLGSSDRRVRPMPRGKRLSAMACTRLGARKASESSIAVDRTERFSRCARSTMSRTRPAISSSSKPRALAMPASSLALVSDRVARACRREPAMQRFRSMKTLQKFSSVHAQVHNHFNQERHLVTRQLYKQRRLARWPSGALSRHRLPLARRRSRYMSASLRYFDIVRGRPPRPQQSQRHRRRPIPRLRLDSHRRREDRSRLQGRRARPALRRCYRPTL